MRFASVIVFAALAGRAWALEGLDPNSWKEFKPAREKFSVKMPGEPKTRAEEAKSPAGPLNIRMGLVETKTFAFMLMWVDYPEAQIAGSDPEKVLDGARDGALRNSRGAKLDGETKIKLGEHPGRELHMDMAGRGKMLVRIFLVKNRLYQTLVGGKDVTYDDKDVRTFVESLKLE